MKLSGGPESYSAAAMAAVVAIAEPALQSAKLQVFEQLTTHAGRIGASEQVGANLAQSGFLLTRLRYLGLGGEVRR